jgi:hypothetical protein
VAMVLLKEKCFAFHLNFNKSGVLLLKFIADLKIPIVVVVFPGYYPRI